MAESLNGMGSPNSVNEKPFTDEVPKKIEISRESATVDESLSVATADERAEFERREAAIEAGWERWMVESPESALPITRIIVEEDKKIPVRVSDRYWGETYDYYSETLVDPKTNRRFSYKSTKLGERLEEELPEL